LEHEHLSQWCNQHGKSLYARSHTVETKEIQDLCTRWTNFLSSFWRIKATPFLTLQSKAIEIWTYNLIYIRLFIGQAIQWSGFPYRPDWNWNGKLKDCCNCDIKFECNFIMLNKYFVSVHKLSEPTTLMNALLTVNSVNVVCSPVSMFQWMVTSFEASSFHFTKLAEIQFVEDWKWRTEDEWVRMLRTGRVPLFQMLASLHISEDKSCRFNSISHLNFLISFSGWRCIMIIMKFRYVEIHVDADWCFQWNWKHHFVIMTQFGVSKLYLSTGTFKLYWDWNRFFWQGAHLESGEFRSIC